MRLLGHQRRWDPAGGFEVVTKPRWGSAQLTSEDLEGQEAKNQDSATGIRSSPAGIVSKDPWAVQM
jgi:hypothetical protein